MSDFHQHRRKIVYNYFHLKTCTKFSHSVCSLKNLVVFCVFHLKNFFIYSFIFLRTFLFWIWIFLFFSYVVFFFYQGFHFQQNFASETCFEVQKLDESKWWKAHFMSLDLATQHVMDFFLCFSIRRVGVYNFSHFSIFHSFLFLSHTSNENVECIKCWIKYCIFSCYQFCVLYEK